MSRENWNKLGEKLRDYRPTVDADAAWLAALEQLEKSRPAAVSLRWLLLWKGGELLGLLLFVWLFGTIAVADPAGTTVEPTLPPMAELAPAPLSAPSNTKHITPAQGNISEAGSPQAAPQPGETPAFATPRAQITTRNRPLSTAVDANALFLRERSQVEDTGIALQSNAGGQAAPMATTAPAEVDRAVAPLPPRPVSSLPLPGLRGLPMPDVFEPSAPTATVFALEMEVGIHRPQTGAFTPYVGGQLRLPVGPRGEVVLGVGYHRVSGLDLYWKQAEIHKDFGYATGNAVERWLDSYGAWAYRIGYRHRVAPRWSLQTDLQLTVLQERGLQERIQGSDFFLGANRRSLVDRDFGLRIGVDYRLTSYLGVYTQYVQGLGDITPNHLYGEERTHRHGGARIGLRLMLIQR
jgi:hypothetical protein